MVNEGADAASTLWRVNPNGTLDQSFGGAGLATVSGLNATPDSDGTVVTFAESSLHKNVLDAQPSSASLTSDGRLRVFGSTGDDNIRVSRVTGGKVEVAINGKNMTFDAAKLTKVGVLGTGGNNLIKLDPSIDVPANILGGFGSNTIFGGAGNDEIFGGSGADHIDGGAGNDTIFGNNGVDHIDGGSGDDVLIGGAGADHMDGGPGNDTAKTHGADILSNIESQFPVDF